VNAVRSEIVLDRVRVAAPELIRGELAQLYVRNEPRIAESFDGIVVRNMIAGWGQTSRITLRCPATWWQHLRLALRERWPRLFGRLAVRFDEAFAENGAIVTGLSAKLGGAHLVIPYAVPVSNSELVDDPSEPEVA
jgi:hypothetical protein